jgi:hypothetical protein
VGEYGLVIDKIWLFWKRMFWTKWICFKPIHGIIGMKFFNRFVVNPLISMNEIILQNPVENWKYKPFKKRRNVDNDWRKIKPYLSTQLSWLTVSKPAFKSYFVTQAGHAISLMLIEVMDSLPEKLVKHNWAWSEWNHQWKFGKNLTLRLGKIWNEV